MNKIWCLNITGFKIGIIKNFCMFFWFLLCYSLYSQYGWVFFFFFFSTNISREKVRKKPVHVEVFLYLERKSIGDNLNFFSDFQSPIHLRLSKT